MAEGDVGRRDVDAELHAQRPTEGELRLETALRQHVDGVLRELRESHRSQLYGRYNRLALVSANGSQGERRRRRRIRKLRLLALLVVLGLVGIASFAFGLVTAIAGELPKLDPARYRPDKNSYIYTSDGRVLAVLRGDEARIVVKSEEIADVMKQAIVAVEDRRFFEHRGIDVRGIARAVWQDLRNRAVVEGGSTITQQFVKNAYVKSSRSFERKLKEAALAWQLEQQWSKDRILTAYLNTIYFGNGAYGIEQASRVYFRHKASSLTLAESALLAGIPADPTLYDPVSNPRQAKARRHTVLRAMLDQGDITRAEYWRADHEPLPEPADIRLPGIQGPAPYFTNYVKQQLIDEYGTGAGLRRRPARTDVDRPRPAAARARGDRQVAARRRRPVGGARRHRPSRRPRARDVRRPQLRGEPVQPRRAGRASARLGVQAVRPRGGARPGNLPHDVVRLGSGHDLARRPPLARRELRGIEPRHDRPGDGDDVLRQHRLRAARRSSSGRRRSRRWPAGSASRARSRGTSR